MVRQMRSGSVIVDVAVDQGGCVETIRPTSHSEPVYVAYGILHYAVPNMPGSVPRTSTQALTNATLPYISKLAQLGVSRALAESRELVEALNTRDGRIEHPRVAEVMAKTCTPA